MSAGTEEGVQAPRERDLWTCEYPSTRLWTPRRRGRVCRRPQRVLSPPRPILSETEGQHHCYIWPEKRMVWMTHVTAEVLPGLISGEGHSIFFQSKSRAFVPMGL